jgi:hypothetical protein
MTNTDHQSPITNHQSPITNEMLHLLVIETWSLGFLELLVPPPAA